MNDELYNFDVETPKPMRTLLLLFLPAAAIAQSQPPVNTTPKFLDKNQVKAAIYTENTKFWDPYVSQARSYEVPAGSGRHLHYGNALWIGGYDAGNALHMSAQTYRQSGTDFWPGPLDTTNIATYSPHNTSVYNNLWKVDCDEINGFVNAFNQGAVTANTYTVPSDILSYPAKGIGKFQRNMAPFFDVNNDGQYTPAVSGDYPLIRGHQQVLSIYNDQLFTHTETQGMPMGLEIHERSYAFSDPALPDSMQAVNYTTFYHYTIFNRSGNNYYNVYICDWSDADLGYYLDDYIGTDTINQFAYCYNSTNFDPTMMGTNGYGNKPPVVSYPIMRTDCSNDGIDNNNNMQIDEPSERFMLDRSTYYLSNIGSIPPAMTNPVTAQQFYNYMSGSWRNGSQFTLGGNAFGGTTPARHVYTGDPSIISGWTEQSAGNQAGDRKILSSSGPFTFPAGGRIEWGFAVVFSQDTTQAVNTISQFNNRVRRDVRNVMYYHDTHLNPQCAPPVTVGLAKVKFLFEARVYPNPATDRLDIQFLLPLAQAEAIIYDVNGREVMYSHVISSNTASLDVSGLPAGVYCLSVNCGEQILTKKFVKAD
jgi:hypothetical protein